MARQKFDRSSKWLIEEEGLGILYLAGVRNALSAQAIQSEVVQPASLPDGLLQVKLAGEKEPRLFLLEMATYPEKRVPEQMHDDIMLVRQARGVLPEAVVLVLAERGTYRVPERLDERSLLGWTTSQISWKVVELWTLAAEELLTAPNVGTVPWASLAQFEGTPEVLLQRCRDRIEKEGGRQHDRLLAVTQAFVKLRFDRPDLLALFGGTKAMFTLPLFKEAAEEFALAARVEIIIEVLTGRFDSVPPAIAAGLSQVKDPEKLRALARFAGACPSIESFAERLEDELPKPPPASTRGKRRSRKPSE